MIAIKKIQDPNVLIPCEVEVLKEKNGVRLIRENIESNPYHKPQYVYGVQIRINGEWGKIEWQPSYARAKNYYEWESQFEE